MLKILMLLAVATVAIDSASADPGSTYTVSPIVVRDDGVMYRWNGQMLFCEDDGWGIIPRTTVVPPTEIRLRYGKMNEVVSLTSAAVAIGGAVLTTSAFAKFYAERENLSEIEQWEYRHELEPFVMSGNVMMAAGATGVLLVIIIPMDPPRRTTR